MTRRARSTAMDIELTGAWQEIGSAGHCVTIACALALNDGNQHEAAVALKDVSDTLTRTGNMSSRGSWHGGIPLALRTVGYRDSLTFRAADITVSTIHKVAQRYNKLHPKNQVAAIVRVLWSGKRVGHAVYVDEHGPVNGKRASRVHELTWLAKTKFLDDASQDLAGLIADERAKKAVRTAKFHRWREEKEGW